MEHNLDDIKTDRRKLPLAVRAYLFPHVYHLPNAWEPVSRSLIKEKPQDLISRKKPSSRSQRSSVSQAEDRSSRQAQPSGFEGTFFREMELLTEQEIREDDERGERVRAAVAKLLEDYNITKEELRQFLEVPPVVFSRLRITRTGAVLLTDYHDLEVKMDVLSKVIFILFLRHSEGIAYRDLGDHKDEMMQIYYKLTHRYDMAGIEESIDRLCNTVEENSIHEKVSRIKRAFINVVDEDIASQYYIKGPAGDIRRIELRRDLVSIQLLL